MISKTSQWFALVCISVLLIACDNNEEIASFSEESSDDVSIEDRSPIPQCVSKCYLELLDFLKVESPEEYRGTACDICGETTAHPGDTLTLEGVFLWEEMKCFQDTLYSKKWEIPGEGASVVGSDSSINVVIAIHDEFQEVVVSRISSEGSAYCYDEVVITNN